MRTPRPAAPSRIRLPATLLLAALALTGCSGGSMPPAATPSAPAPAGSNRSATPDEAGQAFLRALGNLDAAAACRVMAAGGQVIETQPEAMQLCIPAMDHAANSVGTDVGEALKRATVTGAHVDGDRADFARATTTPAGAAQILGTMQAIRLNGVWYVTA